MNRSIYRSDALSRCTLASYFQLLREKKSVAQEKVRIAEEAARVAQEEAQSLDENLQEL